MTRSCWILLATVSTGCATGAPVGGRFAGWEDEAFTRPSTPRPTPSFQSSGDPVLALPALPPGARDTAVLVARSLVGKSRITIGGKQWGDDCTGLVRGVYAQVGIDLISSALPSDNGVTAIWRYAKAHGRLYDAGRPVAGDLVFFKDTFDLNHDGEVNDGLTHIGLVERTDEDGTVIVIHRVSRGVVRYKMNLKYRDLAADGAGHSINDYLRNAGPGRRPRLTSQLFAGYATLLPIEPRLAQR